MKIDLCYNHLSGVLPREPGPLQIARFFDLPRGSTSLGHSNLSKTIGYCDDGMKEHQLWLYNTMSKEKELL
ncbi:hypothetical protein Hanom_Chr16g01465271 [Helianthus anomalus]